MHRGDTSREPHEIGGRLYFSVRQFAERTNRTGQSVRHLITRGNRIRQLRMERIGGHPFIPAEELTEFPFTFPGNTSLVSYYDEGGNVTYVDEREEEEHEVQNPTV